MENKDDGGSAFPIGATVPDLASGGMKWEQVGGMSLRDYFAAKAMFAAISTLDAESEIAIAPAIAADAYKMADAMLTERKKS